MPFIAKSAVRSSKEELKKKGQDLKYPSLGVYENQLLLSNNGGFFNICTC